MLFRSHVLDETSLRRELGEAGYETYRTRFTEDVVLRQYLDLFTRVTKSGVTAGNQ